MNRYHYKVNLILKISVPCFDIDFPVDVQYVPLLHDLSLLVFERTLSTNAVFSGGQIRCQRDDSLRSFDDLVPKNENKIKRNAFKVSFRILSVYYRCRK